jgi:hypothetical protein
MPEDKRNQAAEFHKAAAKYHQDAAYHYREAAKHLIGGDLEKAGYHAWVAHGYALLAAEFEAASAKLSTGMTKPLPGFGVELSEPPPSTKAGKRIIKP